MKVLVWQAWPFRVDLAIMGLWLVTNPGKTGILGSVPLGVGQSGFSDPTPSRCTIIAPLPFSAISASVVGYFAGLGRPRSRSALLLLSPQRGPETNLDNESTT